MNGIVSSLKPGKRRVQRFRSTGCEKMFVALGLIAAWAQPSSGGMAFPRDRITFPFAPAAMAEGPSALRLNPAALGADPNFAADYYHSYTSSSWTGDDALYTSLEGFGFGMEWLGDATGHGGRAHTIGLGTSADWPVSFGSSYQWRSSDDPPQDKSHFWSQSILWRPNGTLSFAAVADNQNRMKIGGKKSDAEFTYSAAVALLDGRLKIGGDWYQLTSQRVQDGTYRAAASYQVRHGLTVFGDIDEAENYFLGARIEMTDWLIGTHTAHGRHDGYQGGVAYLGFRASRSQPLVNVRREVVYLDVGGDIPDREPPRRFFGPDSPTTFDLVKTLDKAAIDPTVRGVVLRIDDPQLGWARMDELRNAIGRVRDAGKHTLAYVDGQVNNKEYYLASAADRVVVPPVSTVDLIGLRAEVTFAKRLLDKVGVKADLEHIGEYKTASDLLTRTEMSPAHREALNGLLDDLDAHWTQQIAADRHVQPERVRNWIDYGPYISVDAQQAGLVDAVAYPDQLDSLMRTAVGRFYFHVSRNELAGREYRSSRWGPRPKVAVVFAAGSITDGQDGDGALAGEIMGAQTVSKAIRQARKDRRVKAIVLRVNSGGGSVFASDQIWREVKQTVGRKPIVVSFGDVAASGGYYIACAADSIFALPGTITGSIGVIFGKLDLSGLYDKVGIDKEVVTRGRYADIYGSTRSFDDAERDVVREQMERAYERFVQFVADGRDLSTDSVDAMAQGRVWSGVAAEKRGLVDRLADLHETIAVAARMGGVKPGREIDVEILPERRWRIFDWPAGDFALASLPAGVVDWLRELSALAGLSGDDDGLSYEPPYRVKIQ